MPALNLRLPSDVHERLKSAQELSEASSLQEFILNTLLRRLALDEEQPRSPRQRDDAEAVESLEIRVPGELGGISTGGPWTIVDPVGKLEAKYFSCGRPVCWKSLDYEVHRVRSAQDPSWCLTVDGVDLMATHLMNSRLRDIESYELIKRAPQIAAALANLDDEDLGAVDLSRIRAELLALFKAVRVNGVGIAKATKLLALKRPMLIPMIDSQVVKALYGRTFQFPTDPAEFALEAFGVIQRFQALMRWSEGEHDNYAVLRHTIQRVESSLARYQSAVGAGDIKLDVSPARALESLLWFDWWGAGYYGYRWDRGQNRVVRAPGATPQGPPLAGDDL